ncbi:MAG: carbon-nitrogen family hydrolase [Desulfobacteraceae bacterium]|nr:MAG: carbon-nitrogen family hydrolase [Desulfobacteraceae bacterium]
MKIAALQMDLTWHDRVANFKKAQAMAAAAKAAGVDLIVLPETFATGFSMDASFTAETLDGPTPAFLRSLARDLKTAVIGGFVLKQSGSKPYNVALAVDRNGADLALYAKIHLVGILGETEAHAPGSRPIVFQWEGIRIGCFICYDLRFPELFAPQAEQCDLMIVIASWPEMRQKHWDLLLQARAIENQCFLVGVNRVGQGGGYSFRGGSAIINPLGEILAHGADRETVVMATIDPDQAARVRTTLPFLKDRRPELYK